MNGTTVIVIVAAALAGITIGILAQKLRGASGTTDLEKKVSDLSARLEEREQQLLERDIRLKALAAADAERAALASTLDGERKSAAEKITLLEQADVRL